MKAARPSGAISAATAGRHSRAPPCRRERRDEDGQNDHDAGVAGQAGDAGAQRRGHPVAPRQGEEAEGGCGQEESLGVAEGQDVGRRAEDVEEDGPVRQPRAEDLPHGEPDGERGGQPEHEGRHDGGVGQAQACDLGDAAHRRREAREEGPTAAVALVEQVVGVAVLRDLQVPGAVPDRAHGPDEAQLGEHGARRSGPRPGGRPGRARSRRRGGGVAVPVWSAVFGWVLRRRVQRDEAGRGPCGRGAERGRRRRVDEPGHRGGAGGRKAQPRRREKRNRAAAQQATVAATASPTRDGPASALTRAIAAVVATRLTP